MYMYIYVNVYVYVLICICNLQNARIIDRKTNKHKINKNIDLNSTYPNDLLQKNLPNNNNTYYLKYTQDIHYDEPYSGTFMYVYMYI